MSLKRFTSIMLFFTFIGVLLSTIALYITPPRIYTTWIGWNFLFVDLKIWRDIHIVVGFIFFVFLLIHIILNFKLLIKYVKKKGSVFISKEFGAACIVSLFIFLGTWHELAPFKKIVFLGPQIKRAIIGNHEKIPYRYAHYSDLNTFCEKTGYDFYMVESFLKKNHFNDLSGEKKFIDIASSRGMSSEDLYLLIKNNLVAK